MLRAPRHVQPFVKPAIGGVDIPGRFGENHAVWKVVCRCGSEEFGVFKSALPRVLARCVRCGQEIVLYDIRKYPAAKVIPADDTLQELRSGDVLVYVMYEYPDLDEGEVFDSDDITWCQVFVKDAVSGQVAKVVDHETA
jgi:hypothetical protein